MSLKSIKEKIRGIDKAHKVTKAMGAVSAVKMRKSQDRAFEARPYALHAISILKRVSAAMDAAAEPLLAAREVRKTCLVAITSDKGLAGNLNNAVLRKINSVMRERDLNVSNVSFVCMGKKGFEFFSKRGYSVERHWDNFSDDVSVEDMREVSALVADGFLTGRYDECLVFYTNFISTFQQEAEMRKILPIDFGAVEQFVEGILPVRGKFAHSATAQVLAQDGAARLRSAKQSFGEAQYIFEPDIRSVLSVLLPHLLNIEMYHALLEAKASEHSARMVAMRNASDKAEELSAGLNLRYNKERQALITREVSEIVGGIEAMAS